MIKVQREISGSDLGDIMCTAIEGNDMTLAWCGAIHPEFSTEGLQSPWYCDPSIYKEGLKLKVMFDDPENGDAGDHADEKIIEWKDFVEGVQIMSDKHSSHFADWVGDNADALTGDVFWQCIVLKDVVYG